MENHQEATAFVRLLKECIKKKDLCKGIRLHSGILTRGLLQGNISVATTLICMYAKLGLLAKAREIHDQIICQDVVCWNALISGHAQEGEGHNAITCFERMQCEGLLRDDFTFSSALKACGDIVAFDKGKQIHHEIVNRNLMENNLVLGNVLVDMYAKFNMFGQAKKVFDDLSVRNVISWSSLIAGYVQQEQCHQALTCYEEMLSEGISPNAVTFTCILKACGILGAVDKGKRVHGLVENRGLLGTENVMVATALLGMYAKCGILEKAQEVHDSFILHNTVSWSALISGYCQQGQGHEALKCYRCMQREGFSPDAVTLISVLKACGSAEAIDEGKQIHDQIISRGLLEKNLELGNALVDMYAKCGLLGKAEQVHQALPARDAISWNALIAGYVQNGQDHEALRCFAQMKKDGISPDAVTFVSILKVCSSIKDIDKGKEIHYQIMTRGLLHGNIRLGTALVDMYSKCGMLTHALKIHNELPVRDTVSWNALIAGHVHQDQNHEALKCFEKMQSEGLSPDTITLACITNICVSVGAIDKGKQIHEEMVSRGLSQKDVRLGAALICMYAKCGFLGKAQQLLYELPNRNVLCWNSLIEGYAKEGQGEEALNCFGRMQREGLSPDTLTMLYVLTACSHSGLVDEAEMYFKDMSEKYGISPGLEHYACMVDVFGSAGDFDKVTSMVEEMPCSKQIPIWVPILNACSEWGNLNLGRVGFDQSVLQG